jgi:hypothetical protein
MASPGSRYCFLVVVAPTGAGSAGGSVVIDARATKAEVVEILPVDLAPGVVGEVCVEADPTTVETSGTVTITGTRDGATATVVRSLPVFPMADERAAPSCGNGHDLLSARRGRGLTCRLEPPSAPPRARDQSGTISVPAWPARAASS